MVKKINLDRFYRIVESNIFIIFLFAILSIFSGLYFLKSNMIFNAWDIAFHLSRIFEIQQSLVHGNGLPKVMLNTFVQNGSAVMTMYPGDNLLFSVIVSFFVKSLVHFMYVMFILRNFFALIMTYYSCYSFNKNKKISFIFSISYTLSVLVLHFNFWATDLGISTSLIYLPLVLFGTLLLLEKNKWKELTIGISMVILSHVITAVLAIILVGTIILINYKKINKELLRSLGKAVGVTLLITSIFSIPFTMMITNNHIAMPSMSWQLTGVGINDLIGAAFSNSIYVPYIGIASLVGLILSIINYKNLPRYSKQIFWISVILIIIVSPLFPWNMFNNTFIRPTFQRPYRLYVIAQVLLSYLFAENAITLCKNQKQRIITILVITLSVLVTQVSGQKEIINNAINNNFDTEHVESNLNHLTSYYTDYFPKESVSLNDDMMNHRATYGNNKKVTVNLLGNGKFAFKLNRTSKSFKLPFLIYNSINYQIKVDGRNTRFYADDHSQLTLGHMNKGKHNVQVIVHKSWYDYLSYVLSVIGVMVLAFAWIRSLILKRNK